MLDNLIRVLEAHSMNIVVKISDNGNQHEQALRFTAISKHFNEFIGGFVMLSDSEEARQEVLKFCRKVSCPIIFMDVRPFDKEYFYPTEMYPADDP